MDIFSKHMDMSWVDAPKQAAYRAAWGTAKEVRAMVNWYRASNLKVADPGVPLPAEALPKLPAKALRVPMSHLLLWGEEDTALLPECHAGLEELCDDLTRITLPGADHWLLHQKPSEVARHILQFLR
jgi:pimeloyl-ACP methyl ester carboxylesterase